MFYSRVSQKTRKVHSRITNPRLFIQFHQRRCERAMSVNVREKPSTTDLCAPPNSKVRSKRTGLRRSVAFSRRMLKALRLPWRPTTTAARCNYLKNARRSPIPPPTTPGGCRVQSDAKVAGWTFAFVCRRYDQCHATSVIHLAYRAHEPEQTKNLATRRDSVGKFTTTRGPVPSISAHGNTHASEVTVAIVSREFFIAPSDDRGALTSGFCYGLYNKYAGFRFVNWFARNN